MVQIKTFVNWMTLRGVPAELAVAQFRELRKQVPLLYALLSVNAVAVAYTHFRLAPDWMTIWIPLMLVGVSVIRMIAWLRQRASPISTNEALHQLRRTTIVGSALAIAYISWALNLSQYGGDHEQAHVAIFIAITVIGCIFCLMPLPQAALAVTGIVITPSLYYYLSIGDTVYAAIGINMALVTIVIIRVVIIGYSAFVRLVRARSELDRLNREVTLLANTDPLTAIPNRRRFFAELARSLDTAKHDGSDFAVGVIDLDRFKSVNDTMGHLFGDKLLQAAAERLQTVSQTDGLFARLGGDEFAFQISAGVEEATTLANKLCAELSRPYLLGDKTVSVGATCGLAMFSVVGESASIYDAADYALYNGKSDRRGFTTLYAAEHEERIRAERAIESALQSADLENEMCIHFQPLVGQDGHAFAVEALARWTSPTIGPVRPDIFIPLAEKTGIVHRLTLTLFEKSIRAAEMLPDDIKLSFNLSAHDLTSSDTVLGLIAAIRRSTVPASRIVFELTETALMRDFDVAKDAILLLRRLGVEIALDDFGTGYSSLGYLRRLPIDRVKIDRCFVADAGTTEGRDLLAAIIALCSKMKIGCIAEGVEDIGQLNILEDLGCKGFQGYFFSKPLPPVEIFAWLANRNASVSNSLIGSTKQLTQRS
jgi:diguanylate cyclase (GGDEF)-like protein